MMRRRFFRVMVAMVALLGVLVGFRPALAAGPKVPKNVILMISDGWGYNHILATNYYDQGRQDAQPYEQFPVRYAMSHYPSFYGDVGWGYDPQLAWTWFDYVRNKPTDSASAATAMATGYKTYNAAIGMNDLRLPLTNLMQHAKILGKSGGVISTVQFSHATPAGFVAHNISRNNYAAIASEMILQSQADVIMGAGHPDYNDSGSPRTSKVYQYVGGESTWQALLNGTAANDADNDGKPDPWTLIQDRSQFQALMTGSTPKRVVGVAKVATTTQQARGDTSTWKAAPFVTPLNQNVPTLAEMSRGAINVLDNNPKGFFLMIEGGAIDWASHAQQSGRMIEDQMDFNAAVQAMIQWVETNSNWDETLLIVTGDHETGYLTGPNSGPDNTPRGAATGTWNPIVNNGKGVLPGMTWHSGDHTNSLVPVFAKGASSEILHAYATEVDPRRGRYIDNTNIAGLIMSGFQASASTASLGATQKAGVNATVTLAGQPLSGALVLLCPSASGAPRTYPWQGQTDAQGKAQITIATQSRTASGYYTASAVRLTTGEVLGQWASIPINGGRQVNLNLPIGQLASLGGQTALALASTPKAVLAANSPNPFNPSTQIAFELPEPADARLAIYNLLGQELRVLARGPQEAGLRRVTWDGRDERGRAVASGTYFYRLVTGDVVQTRSMQLLK